MYVIIIIGPKLFFCYVFLERSIFIVNINVNTTDRLDSDHLVCLLDYVHYEAALGLPDTLYFA
jgi:hypothetical protein